MRGAHVESESEFVWDQIKFILKLPITLIYILIGKRRANVLLEPLKDLWDFILEPKATLSLIIANIAMFIVAVFVFSQELLKSLIFMPEHLWNLNLLPMAASWFLHVDIAHLFGNMLMLFIMGRVVEKHFGAWKMILFYFIAAIVASAISALVGQGGVGASGAISGIIGVAILVHPFYRTFLILGIPIPIIILGWAGILSDVLGILQAIQDNIGHWAHLGGYISVALLAYFMNWHEKRKLRLGLIINIAFVIVAALIAYYFGYNLVGG